MKYLCLFFLALSLTACNQDIPTLIAITSPGSGEVLSGKTAVQLDVPDGLNGTARVFVRGSGSEVTGVSVGSAVSEPFVVSWDTAAFPSRTPLELYAEFESTNGEKAKADPVEVSVNNDDAPLLDYVIAYTVPLKPGSLVSDTVQTFSQQFGLEPNAVTPPESSFEVEQTLDTLQTDAPRNYVAEWGWDAVSGADGFGVYVSRKDAASGFEKLVSQAASAAGKQTYTYETDLTGGSSLYGSITTLTNSAKDESSYSNADSATFLGPQGYTFPTPNASVGLQDALEWPSTAGAVGYIYYVYDRNPWAEGAQIICSNYPKSQAATQAVLGNACSGLASGTYFWWVAGVSFDSDNKADGFSFSEPTRFSLP